MAVALQGMQGNELKTKSGANLFGIRHLSPAGAWHLKNYLDNLNPDYVLIESPSDTSGLISQIARKDVTPPIAVLCYTTEIPIYSLSYPLAVYSPEYQGILWANKNKKNCRFIDLPSNIKLPLYSMQDKERIFYNNLSAVSENEEDLKEKAKNRADFYEFNGGLYEKIAEISGEENYDAYWERNFEHNLDLDFYLKGISTHSSEMRNITADYEIFADPLGASINALRESYMQRCIQEIIDSGVNPEKIVVIVGAYHLKGLMENEPMTDKELGDIPWVETKMTLMPYSYYKLSTYSGYGAGNHAPYYFEMMWNAIEKGKLDSLPSEYLSMLNQILREKNGYASTATVIEAVRIANSLNYIHDGLLPTLKDLHDSAVSTMGGGYLSDVIDAFAKLDVGTRIGNLPEGVSQTPIQEDMNYQLKRLKLDKYKSVVAQDLSLDLRENRKVKSKEAAFLDLNRSIFLNRLLLLDINFVRKGAVNQDSATWAENWILCWTPEVEIKIVEAVLLGDSIETAAAYVLRDKLEKSSDVGEVSKLVRIASECALPDSMYDALNKLQSLGSDSENFSETCRGAREISFLVQYGNIRKFDIEPIVPILQQLFLKSALLVYSASACDDSAAREMVSDFSNMHNMTQEHEGIVNDEVWLGSLFKLSKSDEKNPFLCGLAFSVLLERNKIGEDELSIEVSKHLSSGNLPEAGAKWFEGLSQRNRYVLLSRIFIWKQLDEYISMLDNEEFKRTLVCLRRAFSAFDMQEQSGICEILADLWGVDSGSISEILNDELSEQEESVLDELNDFDFGDLL